VTFYATKVYAKLTFKIRMTFPPNYPYHAPTIRFETPCYRLSPLFIVAGTRALTNPVDPNVDMHGNICLDILKVRPIHLISFAAFPLTCVAWDRKNGQQCLA
jgi:ubiquitin-protein ligase